MSDNWIVQNLNSALQTWSDKLAEIWTLLTQSPENFKGGAIWSVMTNINGGLRAIGYGLLVLFFAADGWNVELYSMANYSRQKRVHHKEVSYHRHLQI